MICINCSGITSGRVLSEDRYTHRLQKLFCLYLFADYFTKISLHSSEQNISVLMSEAKSS